MNKTTTPYNFTPVDKYTLVVELVGTVKNLVRIYENPWGNVETSHYDQLSKQIQNVKDAIQRYEK